VSEKLDPELLRRLLYSVSDREGHVEPFCREHFALRFDGSDGFPEKFVEERGISRYVSRTELVTTYLIVLFFLA
jgi:hypothetical protein